MGQFNLQAVIDKRHASHCRAGEARPLKAPRHRMHVRRHARRLQRLAAPHQRLLSRVQGQSPPRTRTRPPQGASRLAHLRHARCTAAATHTHTLQCILEIHRHTPAHRELQPQRLQSQPCCCPAAGGCNKQAVAEGGSPAEQKLKQLCAGAGRRRYVAVGGLWREQGPRGGGGAAEWRPLELPLL